MKKKNKILVAGISIVAINLATLFSATIAWFNTNRTVSTYGMVIKGSPDHNLDVLERHIYCWDYDHDIPIETDDLKLEPYDCFITTRNVYARKFLRLSLKFSSAITSNTYLHIQVTCTGALTTISERTGDEVVATNISNLIQFKFYDNIGGAIHSSTNNVTTIYNDCRTLFQSINDNQANKFVQLTTTNDVVTASKPNMVIENMSIPLTPTNSPNYVTEFYIEYTYNEDLIAYYQSHADETFDLNVFTGSTVIAFDDDVRTITIDTITLNS